MRARGHGLSQEYAVVGQDCIEPFAQQESDIEAIPFWPTGDSNGVFRPGPSIGSKVIASGDAPELARASMIPGGFVRIGIAEHGVGTDGNVAAGPFEDVDFELG